MPLHCGEMRYLATMGEEPAATLFGDYLLTAGIACRVERADKGWDVWIENEDDLSRAQGELTRFKGRTDDTEYAQARHSAQRLRAESEKKQKKLHKNFVDVRTHWATHSAKGAYPLTIGLILVSILVTAGVRMGANQLGPVINALRISPMAGMEVQSDRALVHALNMVNAWPLVRDGQIGDLLRIRWAGLWEVRHGQVWRLVTPIFIHFGILHILFDMWWLYDLGSAVETQKGRWKLIGIVLLTGIVGNLAQFFWSGPNFGGMSGVVYGLLGYMWIKGILQPGEGLAIQSGIVWFMLGWLVLCMTGVMGPVGNGAHLFGLLSGVLLAAAPWGWMRMRRLVRGM